MESTRDSRASHLLRGLPHSRPVNTLIIREPRPGSPLDFDVTSKAVYKPWYRPGWGILVAVALLRQGTYGLTVTSPLHTPHPFSTTPHSIYHHPQDPNGSILPAQLRQNNTRKEQDLQHSRWP
ncbi:hypothetical protein BaRGS_00027992 [Batillaria attramentaria]|uniref:Uncharacterized protein n=1 Tax=Batillaria attramentaria TaxID=370345 RepID=A0ABD0K138_9CAEN